DFLLDSRNQQNECWHFVELPLGAEGYDRVRYPKFTALTDLVQMSQQCIQVLQGSSDRFSEANALRLLVHLIGDLHQPLHCGCCYLQPVNGPEAAQLVADPEAAAVSDLESDWGGNALMLPIGGGVSLHHYWDSDLGDDRSAVEPAGGPSTGPAPAT